MIQVTFSLTRGEALALRNALLRVGMEEHQTPVGQDVAAFYVNALTEAKIEL